MISKQLWSPDTCGCQIEQTYDYSTSSVTLSSANVVVVCDKHLNPTHGIILEENQRKNKILTKAQSLFPSQFDSDGVFLGSWSFGSNRILNVTTAPGLTSTQKSNIQNWCDNNLGTGKVIIQ